MVSQQNPDCSTDPQRKMKEDLGNTTNLSRQVTLTRVIASMRYPQHVPFVCSVPCYILTIPHAPLCHSSRMVVLVYGRWYFKWFSLLPSSTREKGNPGNLFTSSRHFPFKRKMQGCCRHPRCTCFMEEQGHVTFFFFLTSSKLTTAIPTYICKYVFIKVNFSF